MSAFESVKAPQKYDEFRKRFPELGDAWEQIGKAGQLGPLSAREARLVKLALGLGAMLPGSVHASVRKAREMGIDLADLEQVVSLMAGTQGMPSAVAGWGWIKEEFEKK